jgi:ABC-type transporter Mla MlaB component
LSGADDLTYRLSGRVTFDNLVQIREEGEAAIVGAGDRAEIDLSGLEHGNSAAVALLMAWFRAAESLDKRIVFEAPPIELVNIVELSGLTDVLPLSGSGTAAARSELDGSQLTTSS